MKCPVCGKWVRVKERVIGEHRMGRGTIPQRGIERCWSSGIKIPPREVPDLPPLIEPSDVVYRRNWRREDGYKQVDQVELMRFYRHILHLASKDHKLRPYAEDFAQEAMIAYARKGAVKFALARKGFWNKLMRKWENVVNPELFLTFEGELPLYIAKEEVDD